MKSIGSVLITIGVVLLAWFVVGAILMPLIVLLLRIGLTVALIGVIFYFIKNRRNKI
jgi:hypothetical protein